MNVLNKGRCSRCLAHVRKPFEKGKIEMESKTIDGVKTRLVLGTFIRIWSYCRKYDKWCRGVARSCKEPPMGMSVPDVNILMKSIMEKSK